MENNFRIVNARIISPEGIMGDASVHISDGRICSVSQGRMEAHRGDIDAKGDYLLPGFIDIHVHQFMPEKGKLGAYISDLSRDLISIGTTGFLWTIGNTPVHLLLKHVTEVRHILLNPPDCCACLGIYLEAHMYLRHHGEDSGPNV